MEKVKWGVRFIEIFFSVLLTTLFSLGVTYFLDKDKCSINIGTSIAQNNQYLTSVVISNSAKNKALKNLEISISGFNEIKEGIINTSYVLNRKNNMLTIDYIPPEETLSLIIVSKDAINPQSIKIAYSGKVKTSYPGDKSDLYTLIISQIIIYTIMLILLKSFQYKNDIKLDKEIDKLNKENDHNLKQFEEAKNKINEINTNTHELRIYYLSRMKDYSKELDFWKNTIRKILYQSDKNNKTNEKIFDMVTGELKTYGTRSNIDPNYDELTYLAKKMNENKNR